MVGVRQTLARADLRVVRIKSSEAAPQTIEAPPR